MSRQPIARSHPSGQRPVIWLWALGASMTLVACRHAIVCPKMLIVCNASASVELSPALTDQDLASGELTARWNARAWRARLGSAVHYLAAQPANSENISLPLDAEPPSDARNPESSSVTISRRPDGGWQLSVAFYLQPDRLRVDDAVEAHVRRDNGEEVASFAGRVVSAKYYPADPKPCGHGACSTARVEAR